MRRVPVVCLETMNSVEADVLQESDHHMVVAPLGTNQTIRLSRGNLLRPMVGRCAGLEFMVKADDARRPTRNAQRHPLAH